MSTPLSTPVRHAKLAISSSKSTPISNDFKRLISDQHQRLQAKHQQDLELIDDIRSYIKARLSIERDYTSALAKLSRHHLSHIVKKFTLLNQCDDQNDQSDAQGEQIDTHDDQDQDDEDEDEDQDESPGEADDRRRTRRRLKNSRTLYRVWHEHVNGLQETTRNRAEQFEQLILIVDKLKDIRSHKAQIGKKCLDLHLKKIQDDLLAAVQEVEKAKKLYYEDETLARKARENEEKIKKKRSGLLTKLTGDLQAKKEKSSAQREATDIQSTQARNDYILAMAAANAHLQHYYSNDLADFIQLIDDSVLDHCKVFMVTLSECDINSLKLSLANAQSWSKSLSFTSSQKTNRMFLNCPKSRCLRHQRQFAFEPCNEDPLRSISLEHNADYALQHEIDKWFTWFKKECRNLNQLIHQLDTCQQAFVEGKKSVELNGQTVEDLESRIIDLKQQIRKCKAAKLKAQARLKAIKDGGMQIEEWSTVELEIRADMARAQEAEQRASRLKELQRATTSQTTAPTNELAAFRGAEQQSLSQRQDQQQQRVQLEVSRDEGDGDNESELGMCADHAGASMQNLASVSRSSSNYMPRTPLQPPATSAYSALTDPSLVWQDDYSNAWAAGGQAPASSVMATTADSFASDAAGTQMKQPLSATNLDQADSRPMGASNLLTTTKAVQHQPNASVSVQSSSPLSAIVTNEQNAGQSQYQTMSEAYKSDYECDYNRVGQQQPQHRSAASSVEPTSQLNNHQQQQQQQVDEFEPDETPARDDDVRNWPNKRVVALYSFTKNNDDDLEFNEEDVMRVIEINFEDTNWVRARHESSGQEGYIPSSYVRLLDSDDANDYNAFENSNTESYNYEKQQNDEEEEREDYDNQADGTRATFESDGARSQEAYCRALYDYKPEANTYEDDGLPHLELKRGDVMRIVDEGEDDGWWLVEKLGEAEGVRGHVPSMLVEEVEQCDEDEADELTNGRGEQENRADGDGENGFLARDQDEQQAEEHDDDDDDDDDEDFDDEEFAAPPAFEAPVLSIVEKEDADDHNSPSEQTAKDEQSDKASELNELSTSAAAEEKIKTQNANSLVPTSFIIIEPTPEVESRRLVDELEKGPVETEQDKDIQSNNSHEIPADGTVVHEQPPSGVSYSVVNENFVLERPNRQPTNLQSSTEVAADDQEEDEETLEGRSMKDEPLAEPDDGTQLKEDNDFVGAHSVVSVVVDTCVDIPRSEDEEEEAPREYYRKAAHNEDSGTENCDDLNGGRPEDVYGDDDDDQDSQTDRKMTANYDLNYGIDSNFIRRKADEFSKKIIDEALMLAPGTDIGPSTSTNQPTDSLNELEEEDA